MPNSVIVGKLRAIHPDHIVLGGGVRILLPAHIAIDGLEVGASLTVVVHEDTDQHLMAESITKNPSDLLGGQPA
jgi:hypothetical protein